MYFLDKAIWFKSLIAVTELCTGKWTVHVYRKFDPMCGNTCINRAFHVYKHEERIVDKILSVLIILDE